MTSLHRTGLVLVSGLTAGALTFGGTIPAGSAPSTNTVGRAAAAPAPVTTTVSGFATSAKKLAFGGTFKDSVRVRTGTAYRKRTVRLEGRRWTGSVWSDWSTVRTGTTKSDGTYVAEFTRSGAWQLRIGVPATSTGAAATTAVRRVTLAGPGCKSKRSDFALGVNFTKCIAKVNGIKVHYFTPTDVPLGAKRAPKVAYYFHGDGEPAQWSQQAYFQFADWWSPMSWALKKGYVVVAPVAPKFGAGNEKWGASHKYTRSTGLALRKFKRAAGASGALYWSTSGGSVYLTRSYIPHVGQLLPGPMALSCGADVPAFGAKWKPSKNKTARRQLDLFFNYGTRDFLVSFTRKARNYYRDRSFTTKARAWKGAPHCQHPIGGPTVSWWLNH